MTPLVVENEPPVTLLRRKMTGGRFSMGVVIRRYTGSTILESFLALRKKRVFSIYTRVILMRTTFRATRGTSSSIIYPDSNQ